MLQVTFSGWERRAYTPLSWDAAEGTTEFVAYVHGSDSGMGIGSAWIASLEAGDRCHIVGPRDAVDLTTLRRPGVLFGDETSFGTAAALRATASGDRDVTCIFEVASVTESRAALAKLNVSGNAILIQREAGERHLDELERLVVATFRSNPATHGILTGKADSIQRLYKALRRAGVSARQVKNKAYWAPGRRGLE
jgi:NADPH-dependent ferric siderophore reductase